MNNYTRDGIDARFGQNFLDPKEYSETGQNETINSVPARPLVILQSNFCFGHRSGNVTFLLGLDFSIDPRTKI